MDEKAGKKAEKFPPQWLRLEEWKQRIKEKKPGKWFRRDNLIVLVLSGVLLFIIAMPMDKGGKEDNGAGTDPLTKRQQETGGAEDRTEALPQELSETEYVAFMEQRLTQALSKVSGVGQVRVMITLKASRELVVERETPLSRQATNEADSQGGSRSVSQVEAGDSVVYRSTGSDSEPYVVKTLTPEIEGVLVVAEGAEEGTVKRTVTAIVQALFGVEAHKVSVVKMETK